MNILDYIILAAVAVWVILVLLSMRRRKQQGKSLGCGGSCSQDCNGVCNGCRGQTKKERACNETLEKNTKEGHDSENRIGDDGASD